MNQPHHFEPALRGYHAVYREDRVNHCPGCERTHWYIGRMTAECAFCATALPIAIGGTRNASSPITVRRPTFGLAA